MPQVNRAEFLVLLETVQPGLSTKEIFEQSSCFVFDNGWLMTFNGEIACRIRTSLPEDFTGAVDAAPLLAVLGKMGEENVNLKLTEKHLKIVGAVGTEAGIRVQSEILLPLEHIEKPGEWRDLPEDFSDAVKYVQETAGTEKDQFVTLCVHIHPKWMESCDRWQATRYKIRCGNDTPFLVRAASLKHVVRFGMHRMAESDNWAHFRNKAGLIYSCRRFSEEYPDLSAMFTAEGTPLNLPKGAAPAAELAGIFSGEDRDNDRVTVTLSEGRMRIRGEGTHGYARKDLELVGYRGDEVQFRISPELLVRVVHNYNECEVVSAGNDAAATGVYGKLRADGEKWRYVTALGAPDARGDAPAKRPEPEPVPEVSTEDDSDTF